MYKFGCLFILLFIFSCDSKKNPKDWFPTQYAIDQELLLIAPYVLAVPDDIESNNWYNDTAVTKVHRDYLKSNAAELIYFNMDKTDSMRFYMVSMRDHSSLYEHYKLYGGMYRLKDNKVDSLVELFISPRLKKEEIKPKAEQLFDQIVSERSIGQFYGNSEYVEWPYKGLVYDVPLKRWVMTPENEMYFLQEARDSVEQENKKIADEIKKNQIFPKN